MDDFNETPLHKELSSETWRYQLDIKQQNGEFIARTGVCTKANWIPPARVETYFYQRIWGYEHYLFCCVW